MLVFKYIILVAIVGFTLYLIVDTTVTVVKKIKQKRKEKLNKDKTE